MKALSAWLVGFALVTSACAGTQVNPDDNDTWRDRGLWVEKEGETTFVMIVGTAENASMGRSFVMSTAEQDARARLTLYLRATASAFRERLARAVATKGKAAGSTEAAGGYQATEDNLQGDRTVAENTVAGMETIKSFTDKDADVFYVLGKVNMDTLRRALVESNALSAEQKALVAENSEVVNKAWTESMEAGRVDAKKAEQ